MSELVAGPQGRIRAVWHVAPLAYAGQAGYRAAVAAFLDGHAPGADVASAHVVEDEAGTRVLVARTIIDDDGSWHRDEAGRVVPRVVTVVLDEGVVLP